MRRGHEKSGKVIFIIVFPLPALVISVTSLNVDI
jgi:hypothetical protein